METAQFCASRYQESSSMSSRAVTANEKTPGKNKRTNKLERTAEFKFTEWQSSKTPYPANKHRTGPRNNEIRTSGSKKPTTRIIIEKEIANGLISFFFRMESTIPERA